jgi:hypothetical protein
MWEVGEGRERGSSCLKTNAPRLIEYQMAVSAGTWMSGARFFLDLGRSDDIFVFLPLREGLQRSLIFP